MNDKNTLTPYEKNIYNFYLRSTRQDKGFTPRKNFNEITPELFNQIKTISKVIKSKKLNPRLFFDAPYKIWLEEHVRFEFYSTFKAVSTYKKYVSFIELTEPDHEHNAYSLKEGMKFIYSKCVDNNLTNVYDYLNVQSGVYPDFLLDLKDRNISIYCLIALNVKEEHINLETKVVDFLYKDFYNILNSLRSKYVYSKKIKPLSIKLIKTIDKILKNNDN